MIDTILDKYINEALRRCEGVVEYKKQVNFRCNVCGDSSKSTNKKRAYILKNREVWVFYCHNCLASMSAKKWLEKYFNDLFKVYIKESCYSKYVPRLNEINVELKKKSLPQSKPYNEKDDIKWFYSINSTKPEAQFLIKKAIEFCEKRFIPKYVYDWWFVATDGRYRNRLVITFRDKEGKIYSYQCRTLVGAEPKYITKISPELNVYNYYLVDTERPVIVIEGPIDTIFVENSIATTGRGKMQDEKLAIYKHKYFLLDNDGAGKQTALKLLKDGQYVFIWNRFIDAFPEFKGCKDMNDCIVKLGTFKKFTFEELEKFFSNDITDKVYLT